MLNRMKWTLIALGIAAPLCTGLARAAEPETPAAASDATELEPIIVEGQADPLGTGAGKYRRMLPCVGDCEDREARPAKLEQLLKGVQTLFIASSIPEKPSPEDHLGLTDPVKTRLDDKLP